MLRKSPYFVKTAPISTQTEDSDLFYPKIRPNMSEYSDIWEKYHLMWVSVQLASIENHHLVMHSRYASGKCAAVIIFFLQNYRQN